MRRGQGKSLGLGDAKGWEFPSVPVKSEPPTPATPVSGGRFDDDSHDEPIRPPKRPPPPQSPPAEPALKFSPQPGFRQSQVSRPMYHQPEEERPPNETDFFQKSSRIPTAIGRPNRHLHHEDQNPIGGDDLLSQTEAPSLAGTSVSGMSQSSSLVSTSVSALSQSTTSTQYSYIPKSELHSLYGQRGKLLSARYYHTWHDGGPAHALRWTSALICPITAEVYTSAPYAGSRDVVYVSGSHWFMKKSHAEHAAAAMAYDCWMLRNKVLYPTKLSLGKPYKTSNYELPISAPGTVRLAVDNLQAEWKQNQKNSRG